LSPGRRCNPGPQPGIELSHGRRSPSNAGGLALAGSDATVNEGKHTGASE
jgi:hypothetical protein